jgi:hypothetical protein
MIHSFCLKSFRNNYLYSDINEVNFIKKYLPLKKWIDPRFVWLALKEGAVYALLFCIPDPFDTNQKRLVVKTIANQSGKTSAGFMYILSNKVIENAIKSGYTKLIHAYMHQSNTSTKTSENFNGHVIRNYELLILSL